jgi:hypothetical protein
LFHRAFQHAEHEISTLYAYRLRVFVVLLYVVAVIIAATGLTLIIDGYRGRPQKDLTERLLPFQPSVADEAQDWLKHRTGCTSSEFRRTRMGHREGGGGPDRHVAGLGALPGR